MSPNNKRNYTHKFSLVHCPNVSRKMTTINMLNWTEKIIPGGLHPRERTTGNWGMLGRERRVCKVVVLPNTQPWKHMYKHHCSYIYDFIYINYMYLFIIYKCMFIDFIYIRNAGNTIYVYIHIYICNNN